MLLRSLLLFFAVTGPSHAETTVEATTGSKVRLPCHLDIGFGRCSWSKGAITLSTDDPSLFKTGYAIVKNISADNCDLVIDSVTQDDDGQWTCTRYMNNPEKLVIKLTVIGSLPEERTFNISKGSYVKLPCQPASGVSRCSWTNGRISLKTDESDRYPSGYNIYRGLRTNNCDLEINTVKDEDSGRWTCIGWLFSITVRLTVLGNGQNTQLETSNPQPTLSLTNFGLATKDQNIINSSTLDLACTFGNDHITPKTMTWTVNGKKANAKEEMTTLKQVDGRFQATIKVVVHLNSTHESQQRKKVTCTAVHETGEYSVTKIFQKKYATTFARLEVLNETKDHTRKLLICEANGYPEPRYMIKMIQPHQNVFADQKRRVTESGDYVCIATYEDSQPVHSNNVTVNFESFPVEVTEARQGDKIRLPCQLQRGFSRCSWTHGNITLDTDVAYLYPPGYTIVQNYTTDNCDLEIVAVSEHDEGEWNCSRPWSNPRTLAFRLKLLDKEAPPTTAPSTTTLFAANTTQKFPTVEESLIKHESISDVSDTTVHRRKTEVFAVKPEIMMGAAIAILLVVLIILDVSCFFVNRFGVIHSFCVCLYGKDHHGNDGKDESVQPVKITKI